jgi:hypothetical protein
MRVDTISRSNCNSGAFALPKLARIASHGSHGSNPSPRRIGARETEASARDIAGIIPTIREQKVPALFFENAVDPRLIRRIAAETGARIGGTLFSDTLTTAAGPPQPTWI